MTASDVSGFRAGSLDFRSRLVRRVRLGAGFVGGRPSLAGDDLAAEHYRRGVASRVAEDRRRAAEELHWLAAGSQFGRPGVLPFDSSPPPNRPSTNPDFRDDPRVDALIFSSLNQVRSGVVAGNRVPRDFVRACTFLRCGILDRTRTLEQGFAYHVLDPIPPVVADAGRFSELCDRMGERIVGEAIRDGRRIDVLWSGGIDSTSALIAINRAASRRNATGIIQVLLSARSVEEYPRYFLDHVNGKLAVRLISHPVSAYLDPAALNVTGEHGDQLFGSHLLESYVRRGVAQMPFRDVLPLALLERVKSPRSALRVERYLAPVIKAAPVHLETLFDYFWWCNFALKWQEVTLRLAVLRANDAGQVYASLRHFFRDTSFQQWAMANTPGREVHSWHTYKEDAKSYIHQFTGDVDYYQNKEKEDSLRHVMAHSETNIKVHAIMRSDFRPDVNEVTAPRRKLFFLTP